jgi:hypothetical protein
MCECDGAYREVCTAATLQQVLAREKGMRVDISTVRKTLTKHGYHWLSARGNQPGPKWLASFLYAYTFAHLGLFRFFASMWRLPRSQKRKYSRADKAARVAFAESVVAMTPRQVQTKLSMAMDGVVLSMPPEDETGRLNFCRHGEDHMWRKRSEGCDPQLAGDDAYGKQVPASRAVPLWGGISAHGFAPIVFHPAKKLRTEEWIDAVEGGSLASALGSLNPDRRRGPWTVLCDNERFLSTAQSKEAHANARVSMWHIPPRSPDLNPIEKYWAWLRKALLARDLSDAVAKRPALDKAGYANRVRALCRTQRAQSVAAACSKSLRKTCAEVIRKKGAATRG